MGLAVEEGRPAAAAERVSFRIPGGDPLFVVHGPGVDDTFIGRDYRFRGIQEVLLELLRDAGYERVVFSSLQQPVFFLDSASSAAARPRRAAPRRRGLMREGLSGPLGRRIVRGDPAVEALRREAPTALTDPHSMMMLDHFMRQHELPTAVVLTQAEELLRFGRAERALAASVAGWSEFGSGRNVCVLVFKRATLEDVAQFVRDGRRLPRLEAYLDEQRARGAGARATAGIGYPDGEELERLVHVIRLREGLRIADWRELPRVARAMAAAPTLARSWLARLRELCGEGRPLSPDELRRHGWVDSLPDGRGARERLQELVGLAPVKEYLEGLHWAQVGVNARGDRAADDSLHLVFTGNPGTGKTTVARLVGELYRELGLLRRGHVVEAEASDLVGGHVGQTAIKTNQVVDRALDGVLLIDEAYRLSEQSGGFGQEAIDTLLTRMENDRDRLAVIAAGYPGKVADFLRSNPGLRSRFPPANEVEFPDYEPAELLQILLDRLRARGLTWTPELEQELAELTRTLHANRDAGFGNARAMRDLASELARNQARRTHGAAQGALEPADLPERFASRARDVPDVGVLLAELDELVGLDAVKRELRQLVTRLQLRRKRSVGGPVVAPHMLFLGPPGTGKTTVARLMGRLLQSLGLLGRGHVVEVSRAELVAGYIGQTAPATKRLVERALDGVLFIDEAYSLTRGDGERDFGREALDTLTAEMENRRGRLVVIAAGYPKEMEAFLERNTGLSSRFEARVEFPDYSVPELVEILRRRCAQEGYALGTGTADRAAVWLGAKRGAQPHDFGNGRAVRDLLALMEGRLADRLSAYGGDDFPVDVFEPEDVPDARG